MEEGDGTIPGRVIMRATSKVVAVMAAVLLGAVPPFVGLDRGHARQEAVPARSARGGVLAQTAHYRFEVFFYSTGVRIFVTDSSGAPMSASGLTGTVIFYHPNSPKPWFARPLHPAPAEPGRAAESLDLAMDLGTVPAAGASVAIEVRGLPDPKEPSATFTMPFAPVDGGPIGLQDGTAMSPAQTYTAGSEVVHYFPVAGFYRMTSGVLIWVPAPGYYYGTSVQYYPRLRTSDWQAARPAAGPGEVVTAPRSTGAPDSINPELYWRPRAWGDTESYQAWLHGEMWRQRLAGRSPSVVGGGCARCHR